MSYELNFKTLKKEYFKVTLDDKNGTVLKILSPSKELMDEIFEGYNRLKKNSADKKSSDELYSLCEKIMNNNIDNIRVTKKEIADCMDYGDVMIFFNYYTDFISKQIDSKN